MIKQSGADRLNHLQQLLLLPQCRQGSHPVRAVPDVLWGGGAPKGHDLAGSEPHPVQKPGFIRGGQGRGEHEHGRFKLMQLTELLRQWPVIGLIVQHDVAFVNNDAVQPSLLLDPAEEAGKIVGEGGSAPGEHRPAGCEGSIPGKGCPRTDSAVVGPVAAQSTAQSPATRLALLPVKPKGVHYHRDCPRAAKRGQHEQQAFAGTGRHNDQHMLPWHHDGVERDPLVPSESGLLVAQHLPQLQVQVHLLAHALHSPVLFADPSRIHGAGNVGTMCRLHVFHLVFVLLLIPILLVLTKSGFPFAQVFPTDGNADVPPRLDRQALTARFLADPFHLFTDDRLRRHARSSSSVDGFPCGPAPATCPTPGGPTTRPRSARRPPREAGTGG